MWSELANGNESLLLFFFVFFFFFLIARELHGEIVGLPALMVQ